MDSLDRSPALERLTRLLVSDADEEVLDRILLDALESLGVAREVALLEVLSSGEVNTRVAGRDAREVLGPVDPLALLSGRGDDARDLALVGPRPTPGEASLLAVLRAPRDEAALDEAGTLIELCTRCRVTGPLDVDQPPPALPSAPARSGDRELVHDLRNHLAGLRTVCDVLQTLGDELEQEERDHYGAVLTRECRRAGELLAHALEPERPPTATGRELLSALEDVIESERGACVMENANLELRLERGVESSEFRLRQVDFSRVLRNLVVNAREASATPAGPTAQVLVECHPDHGGRPGLVLAVTDDGPGVAPELRHRLFEFGTSSKDEGDSGCGLAAVLALVEDAGGEVVVQHLPQRGTRFTVWLPGRPSSAASSDPNPS